MRKIVVGAALSMLLPMHNITCMENSNPLQQEGQQGLRLRCAVMSILSAVRGARLLQGLESLENPRQVEWPASRILLSAFPEGEREAQVRSFDAWLATIEWTLTPLGAATMEQAVGILYAQVQLSGKPCHLDRQALVEGLRATSQELQRMQKVLSMPDGVGCPEELERIFDAFKLLVQPFDPSVAPPPQHESGFAEHMANHERRLRLLREGIDRWATGVAPE